MTSKNYYKVCLRQKNSYGFSDCCSIPVLLLVYIFVWADRSIDWNVKKPLFLKFLLHDFTKIVQYTASRNYSTTIIYIHI